LKQGTFWRQQTTRVLDIGILVDAFVIITGFALYDLREAKATETKECSWMLLLLNKQQNS